MAIRGIDSNHEIGEILSEHLSPSSEIRDPKKLKGREKNLSQIEKAIYSPNRHVFIYGDRGVGKTSLAKTAGSIFHTESLDPIYVSCSAQSTFETIMQAILYSVQPSQVISKETDSRIGPNFLNLSTSEIFGKIDKQFRSNDVSLSYPLWKYIDGLAPGRKVVIIDELDRIVDSNEINKFSELLKNFSSFGMDIRIIVCGIGATISEIMGAHHSVGRYFEPIELQKLKHDDLWSILEPVSKKFNVTIDNGILSRISIISDGFPHFVHLIGECLFYAMYEDKNIVDSANRSHYELAIKNALSRTEPVLKETYSKATEKTKNKDDYEFSLWALCDRIQTKRQITEVYNTSYLRICSQKRIDPKPKATINARLNNLKDERHEKIVIGHGAGWFSMRENVMRGYVRMLAEHRGVQLASEPI